MKRDDDKSIEQFIATIQKQGTRRMCRTTEQRPSSSYDYRVPTSILLVLRRVVLASVYTGARIAVLMRSVDLHPDEVGEFGDIEEWRLGLRAPVDPMCEDGLD